VKFILKFEVELDRFEKVLWVKKDSFCEICNNFFNLSLVIHFNYISDLSLHYNLCGIILNILMDKKIYELWKIKFTYHLKLWIDSYSY